MKTFKGTFANGQQYMGVEAPEDARDIDCNGQQLWIDGSVINLPFEIHNAALLGIYRPENSVDHDHEINMDWCDFDKFGNYKDYSERAYSRFDEDFHLSDSLLSLLDRDSREAFPLDKNPYGDKPEYLKTGSFDEAITNQQIINVWSESESQVRPKTFLIILVK